MSFCNQDFRSCNQDFRSCNQDFRSCNRVFYCKDLLINIFEFLDIKEIKDDIKKGFKPRYIVPEEKQKVVKELKQIAQKYFVAQPVEVNPFKVLLGAMFAPEISTVDQKGQPVTATFERISDYVLKFDQDAKWIKVTVNN